MPGEKNCITYTSTQWDLEYLYGPLLWAAPGLTSVSVPRPHTFDNLPFSASAIVCILHAQSDIQIMHFK